MLYMRMFLTAVSVECDMEHQFSASVSAGVDKRNAAATANEISLCCMESSPDIEIRCYRRCSSDSYDIVYVECSFRGL